MLFTGSDSPAQHVGPSVEVDTQSKCSPSARTLQASCHTEHAFTEHEANYVTRTRSIELKFDGPLQRDTTNKISDEPNATLGATRIA